MPEYFGQVEKVCTSSADMKKEVAKMEERFKMFAERMKQAQAAKAS